VASRAGTVNPPQKVKFHSLAGVSLVDTLGLRDPKFVTAEEAHRQLNYIDGYVRTPALGCKTVVAEEHYIDRDHMEDHKRVCIDVALPTRLIHQRKKQLRGQIVIDFGDTASSMPKRSIAFAVGSVAEGIKRLVLNRLLVAGVVPNAGASHRPPQSPGAKIDELGARTAPPATGNRALSFISF
jgi:hypothetical protein